MQDPKSAFNSAAYGFVSPWFSEPREQPTEDYFPNDYPIDDALVTPAATPTTDDNAD